MRRRKFKDYNKSEKQWFLAKLLLEILFIAMPVVGVAIMIMLLYGKFNDISNGLFWTAVILILQPLSFFKDILNWSYKKSSFYKNSKKARRWRAFFYE